MDDPLLKSEEESADTTLKSPANIYKIVMIVCVSVFLYCLCCCFLIDKASDNICALIKNCKKMLEGAQN